MSMYVRAPREPMLDTACATRSCGTDRRGEGGLGIGLDHVHPFHKRATAASRARGAVRTRTPRRWVG